jgi:post-segregation antitoxin (ccd killing protein)
MKIKTHRLNIRLDPKLTEEAKAYSKNITVAIETGLRLFIQAEKRKRRQS